MRVVEYSQKIEQGTPEWHALRAGKATASEVSDLMGAKGLGKTGDTYALRKATELIFGSTDEIGDTWQMRWGKENEPIAAKIAGQSLRCELVEHVGQGAALAGLEGNTWASPDRLIFSKNTGLEIKCPPTLANYGKLIVNNGLELAAVAPDYFAQVQKSMLVYETDYWYFMAFHPKAPPQFAAYIVRINRDDAFIERMIDRIMQFVEIRDLYYRQLLERFGVSEGGAK